MNKIMKTKKKFTSKVNASRKLTFKIKSVLTKLIILGQYECYFIIYLNYLEHILHRFFQVQYFSYKLKLSS